MTRLIEAELFRPFDLSTGPVIRATLVRMSDNDNVLLLVIHHIVTDVWSRGLLHRDLAAFFTEAVTGQAAALPPLPIQYADFAMWQRQWFQGEVLEEQLGYWRKQLAGVPHLALPTDRPRPPVQTHAGERHEFLVNQTVTEALRRLGRENGGTLATTLLAAFTVLLAKYTGQTDLTVGSPIANRTQQEIDQLIGFFVNTLVMRTDLSGDPTFCEVLTRVHEGNLAAHEHQDLPFQRIVEELQPERDPSRNPLFQVLFAVQNTPFRELTLSGLIVTSMQTRNTPARFDVECNIWEQGEELAVNLVYNTDLFASGTMERFGQHFKRVLEVVVEDPGQRLSQVQLLDEVEQHQLLVKWNTTTTAYPREQSITDLFEDQVVTSPEAVAVVYGEEQLTYGQLNIRANQLAHYLQRQGVGPETRVGVCLERSLNLVISLVAILKAGGAYVPLEPSYPVERLAYMLTDAQPSVLLTHQALLKDLPSYEGTLVCLDTAWPSLEKESPTALRHAITPNHLAYIIYTSGSTGRPKGAMNTHQGIGNRLQWMQATYHLPADARVVQKTPFSFDVSVWEFFWPLLTGASMVLARPGGHQDNAYLVELLAQQQVTTVHFVPSQLQVVLEHGLVSCQSLQRVICSGEELPATLQVHFFARMEAELHNLYGPTEAAVDVTAWACHREDPHSRVSIGRPMANTTILLLDRFGHLVPVGVPGELYIGGCQLARGYLGRPDLTAEKFQPHPFSLDPGARLYRTGDRTRYREDGTIEFLGRLDQQVKLRGYRIELGEIEAMLSQHPAVQEAVVLCREDTPGEKQLVAYVTTDGVPLDVPALRAALQGHLPGYMVPSAFVVLDILPLTPNGKINRKALPAPEEVDRITGMSYVAPRTPLEELVAAVWQEVLKVERIGIHDNFFELGGHSLLATRVIARLRNVLNLNIPLRSLFDYPVIVELAMEIDAQLRDVFADSHEEKT
jgi:amino acid adenylation domain-containing protein